MCQAYTFDAQVVASVGVARDPGEEGFHVLAPCGICQERLALWGPDVHVGVADSAAADGWSSRALGDVNPYYWGVRFGDAGEWPSEAVHTT